MNRKFALLFSCLNEIQLYFKTVHFNDDSRYTFHGTKIIGFKLEMIYFEQLINNYFFEREQLLFLPEKISISKQSK